MSVVSDRFHGLWQLVIGRPGYIRNRWVSLEQRIAHAVSEDEVRRLMEEAATLFLQHGGVADFTPASMSLAEWEWLCSRCDCAIRLQDSKWQILLRGARSEVLHLARHRSSVRDRLQSIVDEQIEATEASEIDHLITVIERELHRRGVATSRAMAIADRLAMVGSAASSAWAGELRRALGDDAPAHGFDDVGPTLTQALASVGLTHRAAPMGRSGREIVDDEGEPLGVCTAAEAWDLVRSREALR